MIKFTNKKNEKFKNVYLECLYSRTELIHFNYPYELDAEDHAIGEHLERCRSILGEYLLDKIPGIAIKQNVILSNEQLDELIGDRVNYVMKEVAQDITKYVEEVRTIYIN